MAKDKQGKSENNITKVMTRFFLFLTLAGSLISIWMFISWLYKPGNFPIKKVELVNKLVNQESGELQKATAGALKGGFFSLNVEHFREDLLSRLPWVKSVSVRKVWPDKLLVSITEHKPVVRWMSLEKQDVDKNTAPQLLSDEGVIFHPELTELQQKRFNNLALFSGPDNNAYKILQMCAQMNDNLKQLGLSLLQCGMNDRRTWVINLNNKMTIKLGKEEIMHKLERFIKVFMGQLRQYLNSVDYADLRYANGFSIQWNSESRIDVKNNREQD